MARGMANEFIGWMPKVVGVETLVRDIAILQATDSSPFQAEIDHHEMVRNHLVDLYQTTFNGVVNSLARQTHLALRKHSLKDDAGVAALFLIFTDDFESDFAKDMLQAGTKAYNYAEPAMGNATWGDLKERADEFSKLRSPDLENVPGEVLERLQASIQRGLAGKESPAALQRRLNEAVQEAKDIEGSRVAETESTITLGMATDAVMSAAGFGEKRWLSKRDDRVRHSHMDCDEQGWIKLGKSFVNGLRYPGDPNGDISEIINCRCVLVGRKSGSIKASEHLGHPFRGNQWTSGYKTGSRKDDLYNHYKGLIKKNFPKIPEHSLHRASSHLIENTGVMHSDELSPNEAIRKAIRAHIRHHETDYEQNFNDTTHDRSENRILIGSKVDKIYNEWSEGREEEHLIFTPLNYGGEKQFSVTYTLPSTGKRHTHLGYSEEGLKKKFEEAKVKYPSHKFDEVYGKVEKE